jgi:hypothetical protein
MDEFKDRRDRIATAAMQAMLIGCATDGQSRTVLEVLCRENKLLPREQIAKMSYEAADAMIAWSEAHPWKADK